MEDLSTFTQHPDLDTMFDFLDGKLPEKDAEAMEAHLLECELCAAALEEMDRAGGATPENRTRAAEFRNVFSGSIDQLPARPPSGKGHLFFRVAAAVLLALNLGWAALFLLDGTGDRFTPLSAETVRGDLGGPEDNRAALKAALEVYENGQYEQAIGLLKALPDAPEVVELKLLYLGNAQLALDRNQEAVTTLRRLADNPDWTLYRQDALHYLRIAYRRLSKDPG